MTSRSITALALAVLASCTPRAAAIPAPTDSVSLSASRCYGFCPAYTVSVFADGKVEFNGSAFAATHATAKIDPATAQVLVRRFIDSRFAELDSNYAEGSAHCAAFATDGPGYGLSMHTTSKSHSVAFYSACAPDSRTPQGEKDKADYLLLKSLAAAIDSATNAKQWFQPPPTR